MQANSGLRCQRILGSFEALIFLSLLCLSGTLLSFSFLFANAGIKGMNEGDYYTDNQQQSDPVAPMPTQPSWTHVGDKRGNGALETSPWAKGVLSTSKPMKVISEVV